MDETLKKEVVEIPIEDIIPNRFQPRLTFDNEALNELADSIREHGIIQPLVVRKLQAKYEIIAGERRYKAACITGLKKVPCIIMNLNDNESAEVAIIENIQRKEMTPLEEAKSFKKLLDKGYLTQEELAKKMGKSQSAIANKLRLLNLDEVVQESILNGKISERHARSLLKLQSKMDQRNVLSEIINNRLTVKQTDDLIKEKYSIGNNMTTATNEIKSVDSMENSINNDIFKMNNNDKKEEETLDFFDVKEEYVSKPEVNIPYSKIDSTVVNPQLNIINSIGQRSNLNNSTEEIKPLTSMQQPDNSLDIFRFDTNNNLNDNNINKEQEIENVINPSVFSNDNNINSFNINLESIKNNSEDINPSNNNRETNIDLLASNDKPSNKFFVDLNINPNNINNINNLKFALDSINKNIEDIKKQGISINKEEIDLGNYYQIVIRINK